MIGPKKRFGVLKRDGFKCVYCGKNGKDVSLEVDHIIPKSKGGGDEVENLVCCCRECNMGKGSQEIKEIKTRTDYRTKLDIGVKELRDYFYKEWNKRHLGEIPKREFIMLNFLCESLLKGIDGELYKTVLDYPPIWGVNRREQCNIENNELLFKEGLSDCDRVIYYMILEGKGDIDFIIEGVISNNWNLKMGYNKKLNYCIYENINEQYLDLISQYALFPEIR